MTDHTPMQLEKLVSVSSKNKYSILKYFSSLLVLDNPKQHCCMAITLLTKEIKPKNIFYRNEVSIYYYEKCVDTCI